METEILDDLLEKHIIKSWESWKMLKDIALSDKKKYPFINKLASELGTSSTNPVFGKIFNWLVDIGLIECTENIGRIRGIKNINHVEIAMLCEQFRYFQEVSDFIDAVKYW